MSAEGEDRRPLLLVLNAGSSSLKAGLFAEAADGTPEPLARLAVTALAGAPRLCVRDRSGASIEDRPAAEVAPSSYESAVELVLEGLHLSKRLNKDAVHGKAQYRSR